jgi:ABC-2 type transport system ATP-binding protein
VAGLRPADGGTVRVFGQDPWDRPEDVRTALGFMSDDMPVFPMRIDRLLRFASGYYRTWDAELVSKLLESFDLDPRQRTHQLSRGQGTRLRLVLAMAFRPRVLVPDEPAAALDPLARHTLLEKILDVVRDPARSVIVSSHNLHDVARIADQLVVLRRGRVVRKGPTDELIGDDHTLEERVLEWEAV